MENLGLVFFVSAVSLVWEIRLVNKEKGRPPKQASFTHHISNKISELLIIILEASGVIIVTALPRIYIVTHL